MVVFEGGIRLNKCLLKEGDKPQFIFPVFDNWKTAMDIRTSGGIPDHLVGYVMNLDGIPYDRGLPSGFHTIEVEAKRDNNVSIALMGYTKIEIFVLPTGPL